MKEYWINVYEDNELGLASGDSYLANNFRSPNYRIHVKMKDKSGLWRGYRYNWTNHSLMILAAGDFIQKAINVGYIK